MAKSLITFCLFLGAVALVNADTGRKLLQNRDSNAGSTITVSASSPRVDAIAITPALPYPQTGIYCNVSGDSRLALQAQFPLTIRVPVGVTANVIFANVTGPIPGSNSSGCSSVVQQPGTSVVQQPGTSVVQQPGSSVVQQPGSSVVQQPGTQVVQPGTTACPTSVVQQPTSVVQQPTSVVQQPTSVVQQPNTSVKQPSPVVQQPPSPVVQQPPSPVVKQPSPVVQQPPSPVVKQPSPVVQQSSPVVQQSSPVVQQSSPVVQQSSPVVQQSSPVVQQSSPVVQQSSPVVQQSTGKKLLQVAAPIEYISNNGSMGQPQLSVTDTIEGVPSISFKPTSVGQTASFIGALQVAVTTSNDGFGTPYIPYRVDSKISPNCGVTVKFVAI